MKGKIDRFALCLAHTQKNAKRAFSDLISLSRWGVTLMGVLIEASII
jgi:hypothetical protein